MCNDLWLLYVNDDIHLIGTYKTKISSWQINVKKKKTQTTTFDYKIIWSNEFFLCGEHVVWFTST